MPHNIVRGIQKFQKEVFESKRTLFEKLSRSQNPETLFITCSDSRIDPVLVTQSEPGDLFIVRNAGNIIPAYGTGTDSGGEAATIEYAVSALKIRQIVVCGHSKCGAMYGLMNLTEISELPAVTSFLRNAEATRRIINENYPDLDADQRLEVATQENVLAQIQNLRTHPAVASALSRGEMRISGWVYFFERGEIRQYDDAIGKFVPMTGEDLHYLKSPPSLDPEYTASQPAV